jgi:hypothetical protein
LRRGGFYWVAFFDLDEYCDMYDHDSCLSR